LSRETIEFFNNTTPLFTPLSAMSCGGQHVGERSFGTLSMCSTVAPVMITDSSVLSSPCTSVCVLVRVLTSPERARAADGGVIDASDAERFRFAGVTASNATVAAAAAMHTSRCSLYEPGLAPSSERTVFAIITHPLHHHVPHDFESHCSQPSLPRAACQ
jgi:hypothetical protein